MANYLTMSYAKNNQNPSPGSPTLDRVPDSLYLAVRERTTILDPPKRKLIGENTDSYEKKGTRCAKP